MFSVDSWPHWHPLRRILPCLVLGDHLTEPASTALSSRLLTHCCPHQCAPQGPDSIPPALCLCQVASSRSGPSEKFLLSRTAFKPQKTQQTRFQSSRHKSFIFLRTLAIYFPQWISTLLATVAPAKLLLPGSRRKSKRPGSFSQRTVSLSMALFLPVFSLGHLLMSTSSLSNLPPSAHRSPHPPPQQCGLRKGRL